MQEKDRTAVEWAARHGGVVTAPMLQEWGFSPNEVKGRVRRRGWVGIGRGAYRLMPARDGRDRLIAAVTVLERAVISHEAAAELHGFTRLPKGQVVVTVHSRTTHDFPGVVARRAHDLDDAHVTELDGLRVTTPERTVVDLAAGRTPGHIGAIVDDLVARRLLDLPTLDQIATSVARRGKPGTTAMRKVLEPRVGAAHPQSELERRARELVDHSGLPAPLPEFPIPWAPNRRFDDAYPEHRLALEWDSRRYHGQLQAFEADRQRDREATVHGWRVVRFTWADVTENPQMVVETIRRLLAVRRRTAG